MSRVTASIVLSAGLAGAAAPETIAAESMLVFVGTYTGAKSKGIYVSRFDAAGGKLSPAELAVEIASPSFLALHPKGQFLYSVNEVGNFGGKSSGAVSAFAIDRATGRLTLLNQQPSGGGGPCHLVVDNAGKHVLVANYGGGSVASLPIERDGGLGTAVSFVQHRGSSVNPQRQEAPHAHGIYLDRRNRFAFVPDLGLDKVLSYRFDSDRGTLSANEAGSAPVAPGSGPRHFALHPRGRHSYVINEMLCTITAFSYEPRRGGLKELQTLSTLPAGESVKAGYSTAEVFVHPTGRFLYGSNRGHDSIAVFSIDPKSGKLGPVENEPTQGKTPRSFGIDPSGQFLLAANQNSDTIVVFRIDPETGALNPTGQKLDVPTPVCVEFLVRR